LLRKASTCHLLYSEHMQSFVNNPSLDTPINNNNSSTQLFRAERFTDSRGLTYKNSDEKSFFMF